MSTAATRTDAPETAAPATENTISGVKLFFTAKGLCQPEITVRYANADEALARAVTDAFDLFVQIANKADACGITLVTAQ